MKPANLNLFQRASQYLNLSPSERAVIKILWGLIYGALAFAITNMALALSNGGTLNIPTLLSTGVVIFVSTLIHGVAKYLSASNDPLLQAVGAFSAQVGAKVDQTYASLERGIEPMPQDTSLQKAVTVAQAQAQAPMPPPFMQV